MSLAVLADHMASKGRGPDSMLIHMSPREVQGLQALAKANGGSLTVNPDTGLPEAGFLDKLLPTIIGAGLTLAGVPPNVSAMIVGGVQTVRTGDIGKGIQAGLGAYGGANLTSSMTAAGSSAIGSEAAGQSYLSNYAPPGALEGAGAGLSADMAYNLADAGVSTLGEGAAAANQAAASAVEAASPFDKLSRGFDAVKANPMGYATKDNLKYLAAAAGPAIMAGMNVQAKGPQTVTKPGMIRPSSFDPYSGTYISASPYEAAPTRAAGGGLMGMADGGYNPGQLDFAQRSEPVVRMAGGGIAGYAVGGAPKMLSDEELYQQTGSWEEAARLRDEQNNALNQYNWAQAAPAAAAPAAPAAPAADTTPTYFQQNKDVADAYAQNSYGMTPDEFAQTHYDKYGKAEGRTLGGAGADAGAGIAAIPAYDAAAEKLYQETGSWDAAAKARDAAANASNTAMWNKQNADMWNAENKATWDAEAAERDAANLATYKQSLLKNTEDWIAKNPFATKEQIAKIVKDAGMSNADVQSTLDSLVASGKVSAAAKNYLQGEGLSRMGVDTAKWLKDNPNATQKEIDDVIKAAKLSQADAQQVLAHGYQVAEDQNAAALKYIQENKDVARWLSSDQGKAYIKEHPEFDAKDIAYTHYKRYGEKEGRKWGLDTPKPVTARNPVTGEVTPAGPRTEIVLPTTPRTNAPPGTSNPVGGPNTPGDKTINPDGSVTVTPNIPGRPYGGFSGIKEVKDAYTAGGGSLGYIPYVPKTIEEFDKKYNTQTGGSKQAYDYLMGKTPYSPTPYTPTGEIAKPYWESVGGMPANTSKKMYLFDPATKQYKVNPDYAIPTYDKDGKKTYNLTNKDVSTYIAGKPSNADFYAWAKANNLTVEQIAAATGLPITEVQKMFSGGAPADTATKGEESTQISDGLAKGGLAAMAQGGISGDGNLNLHIPLDFGGGGGGEFGGFGGKPIPTAETGTLGTFGGQNNTGSGGFGTKPDETGGLLEPQVDYAPGSPEAINAVIQGRARGTVAGTLYNGPAYMAGGGSTGGQYDLGGYSDGGRLLRGPGDGVSDSIPATIGNKRPARLADGEFVVPARIVSELGNGSTEAGARKLYAMMDRIQKARRSTVGKGKVAKNSRSEKYLPA